jgi:hypothetical protein
MFRSKFAAPAIAVMTGLSFSAVQDASAAKKMSYQDAFAKCKQEISAGAPGSESLSTAQRHSAGGACMHKYGYRLKKKM